MKQLINSAAMEMQTELFLYDFFNLSTFPPHCINWWIR